VPAEPFDAVLMVAFGGPTKPDEIRPFLADVLRGVPVPPERLEEVAHHYEVIGGRSPITELTFRQAEALAQLLEREGPRLPVYVAMRHWHPFAADAVAQMVRDGIRRAVGLVMAPHDSGRASWGKYVQAVSDALERAETGTPSIQYAPPCYNHPDFIEAMAEQIRVQLDGIPPERRNGTRLVFTAHSIPTAAAAQSPYVRQLEISCRLVAESLGELPWSLAYQSRSGNPRDPWLEPDLSDVLRSLAAEGCRSVILAPIGFVCDHAEVLYDLDVEASREAGALGIQVRRASTVNDHPLFIRALADLVRQRAKDG
jgi:ferrochelatase